MLDNIIERFIIKLIHPQAAKVTWLPLGYGSKGFFV